jgi:hypothetical protein
MKAYIMLILLLHDPLDGTPYTTHLQQNPMVEYATLAECDRASELKRTAMLASSLKYPDLAIVNIIITCVDSTEQDPDRNIAI